MLVVALYMVSQLSWQLRLISVPSGCPEMDLGVKGLGKEHSRALSYPLGLLAAAMPYLVSSVPKL